MPPWTCSSCRLLSSGSSLGFLGLFDSLSLFLGSLSVCRSLFLGVSCLLFLFLTGFQVSLGLSNLILGLLKSRFVRFELVLEAKLLICSCLLVGFSLLGLASFLSYFTISCSSWSNSRLSLNRWSSCCRSRSSGRSIRSGSFSSGLSCGVRGIELAHGANQSLHLSIGACQSVRLGLGYEAVLVKQNAPRGVRYRATRSGLI